MGNEVGVTKPQIIEEPDEVKVSRPVLKTSEFCERLAEFNILPKRYGIFSSLKKTYRKRSAAGLYPANVNSV